MDPSANRPVKFANNINDYQGDGVTFGDFMHAGIFVRPGVTDFRKSVNGLASMTQENMRQNPMRPSDSVFVSVYPKDIARLKSLAMFSLSMVYSDKVGLWVKV